MTHVFTSQKGNHRGSEILERFLNAEVVWIPVFSGRERHFEKRRIGRDCWPCRLKFNMADVSKHVIVLDRNIFRVYQLISHDIFILMFCGSLVQCKISVGCSCCTRVSRNRFFFSNFFQTKVEWCETVWRKITQVGRFVNTFGNSEGFNGKMEIPRGRGG